VRTIIQELVARFEILSGVGHGMGVDRGEIEPSGDEEDHGFSLSSTPAKRARQRRLMVVLKMNLKRLSRRCFNMGWALSS
jgi:hypothetical protein